MSSKRFFNGITAQIVFLLGIIALAPAILSLVISMWSAISTGQVTVISLGKFETTHQLIAWYVGWPSFVGPLALLAGLAMFKLHIPPLLSTGSARLTLSCLLIILGCLMMCFSLWFTSIGKTISLVSILSFIYLCNFLERKVGRDKGFLILTIAIVTLLFIYITFSN